MKQFGDVRNLSWSDGQTPPLNSNEANKINFFTTCNPNFHNITVLNKWYLPLLYRYENLKELSPANALNNICSYNKNLKEFLSISLS